MDCSRVYVCTGELSARAMQSWDFHQDTAPKFGEDLAYRFDAFLTENLSLKYVKPRVLLAMHRNLPRLIPCADIHLKTEQ